MEKRLLDPPKKVIGGYEIGKNKDLSVLKLFQDVSTRWDSTCFMLIRALTLQESIEDFIETHGPDWLALTKPEWQQIKYLVDLVRPFCNFTQVISRSTTPTIHHVFVIYNTLLEHLEKSEAKLMRKRKPWKVFLREGLRGAQLKLKEYYSETRGSLGSLYGQAVLLTPAYKDNLFHGDT